MVAGGVARVEKKTRGWKGVIVVMKSWVGMLTVMNSTAPVGSVRSTGVLPCLRRERLKRRGEWEG